METITVHCFVVVFVVVLILDKERMPFVFAVKVSISRCNHSPHDPTFVNFVQSAIISTFVRLSQWLNPKP